MKHREIFSNLLTVPPVFVRLDGRAFHRVADEWNLERPFDERFSLAMEDVSSRLIRDSGLSPDFAFLFSDEISLYFSALPFKGRVEKIDSVAASFAASALTLAMSSAEPLSFDARIIHVTPDVATEYLINRQREAWRNHLNAYCQDALMKDGMSRKDAALYLKGRPSKELHELMFSHGVNLARTPAWQRRGVLVYKKIKNIEGFNPKLEKMVGTVRTYVVSDRELPVFGSPEGKEFLSLLIGSF